MASLDRRFCGLVPAFKLWFQICVAGATAARFPGSPGARFGARRGRRACSLSRRMVQPRVNLAILDQSSHSAHAAAPASRWPEEPPRGQLDSESYSGRVVAGWPLRIKRRPPMPSGSARPPATSPGKTPNQMKTIAARPNSAAKNMRNTPRPNFDTPGRPWSVLAGARVFVVSMPCVSQKACPPRVDVRVRGYGSTLRAQLACGSLLLGLGCSATAQKPVIETALKDPKPRTETFEATLRVLDDHPEYAPEFLAITLRHERALEAILDDTARRLQDPGLARRTGNHLAKYPEGLKQTLIAVLDRISGEPAALAGAAEAMAARPQVAAIVITQREDAVRSTLHALVMEVMKNEKAKHWFQQGMAENSTPLTEIIAQDPKLMAAFAKAIVSVEGAKGKNALKNALP